MTVKRVKRNWLLKSSQILGLCLFFLTAQPSLAADQLVTVVFRNPPENSLVETLDRLFQTSHERVDASTYRFKLPPLKTALDYAELYASFSYVAKTQPAPKYNLADNINSQVVNMHPVQGKASPSPATPASVSPAPPPPQSSASPTLPSGTMVYTQIPLDGGGQIQVDFKPATPEALVKMFEIVFESEEVEKISFYSYRLQLPLHMNPNKAVRIMRLCPYVIQAQRLYS